MWPAITITLLGVIIALNLWWKRRCTVLRTQLHDQEQSHQDLLRQHQQISLHKRDEQDTMFNSMAEGVLLLDGNRRIQWLNSSLREMLNTRKDVNGQTTLEAFRLPELEGIVSRIGGDTTIQDMLEIPGDDKRILQLNGATVRDPKLGKDGAILVFHDLTRIKELENTRREFVANVSHELRTPLALIKGYVETLLDGAKDEPDQATRFLQTIEKHTDRLSFLIDDLLTISRLESGQAVMNRQHVVLHELAATVIEELLARADEGQTIVNNIIPLDLVTMADADRLHQVFFNLIENALRYGKPNGRVTVGGQTTKNRMIEVWVRDNGPGISPEYQERIFERFYRIDKARSRETGGTGLGLSIVKHIVQAHGGEVWVRSQLDQGTTFCFTLPLRT